MPENGLSPTSNFRIRTESTIKRVHGSIRETKEQRKPVFSHILRSAMILNRR